LIDYGESIAAESFKAGNPGHNPPGKIPSCTGYWCSPIWGDFVQGDYVRVRRQAVSSVANDVADVIDA